MLLVALRRLLAALIDYNVLDRIPIVPCPNMPPNWKHRVSDNGINNSFS
jgi:hypothetical protein